jgi:hypothetical protein
VRRRADHSDVLYLALVGGGFVLGLVVGRWWLLVLPAGLGLWVGLTEEIEIPGWFLGAAYAALSAAGVGLGVLARRLARRQCRAAQPPI